VITITKIIQGKISQKYLVKPLFFIPFKHKRSLILEVMVEKNCDKGIVVEQLVFGILMTDVIIDI